MIDMKKVTKGLRIHADGGGYRSHHCDDMECPYRYGDESCDIEELCRDAIEVLNEQANDLLIQHEEGFHEGYGQALSELHGKQFVKVVRCKDCMHGGCRTQKLDGSIFRVVCKKHGTKKNELWMDADWFCADGKRRDEE